MSWSRVRHRLAIDDVVPFELLNAAHDAADGNTEAFGNEHRLSDGIHDHPGVPIASCLISLPGTSFIDPDDVTVTWLCGRWRREPAFDDDFTSDPLTSGVTLTGIVRGRIRYVRTSVSRTSNTGGFLCLPVDFVSGREDMFQLRLGHDELPTGFAHRSNNLVGLRQLGIWVYGDQG